MKNVNHKAIYTFHDTILRLGSVLMLVFNIKQVNLEYILRRTKQNLKHAISI